MTETAVRPTIPADRYAERLRRAAEVTAEHGFDAMLVAVGPDLRYLTGYEAMPLERLTMLVIIPGQTADDRRPAPGACGRPRPGSAPRSRS